MPWKTGRIWRKPFQRQIPSAMTEVPQKSLTDRNCQKDSSEGAGKATASSAEEKGTQEEKREDESENSSVTAFSTDEEPVLLDPDRRGPSGEPGSGGDNDADFEEWQEWQD